ncbi:MAG: caspase family protein, partial [Betaproteobacteria bacterium]|nr:caspase family protein [Betaproteobacteria bacterium]
MNRTSSLAFWLLRLTALLFAGSAVFAFAQDKPVLPAPKKPSRIALVIGNGAYKSVPLPNPSNDARDMAALLKDAGFEVVHRENATLKEMHLALREFGDQLKRESLGLFYFAGHGVQVRGRNFLIPVDADIGREDEVAFSALDVQAVMEKMDTARNHTNLIILDACRDNPFSTKVKLANAGLAQIDAPPGSFVAFATAPGSTAADGNGRNGLYTQHLLTHLTQPGVRIEDAFKQVRAAVRTASKGAQTPWESTSLESELVLKASPPVKRVEAPALSVAPSKARTLSIGAAPAYVVGDWWEWRMTNDLTGEGHHYRRSIVSVDGDSVTQDNGLVRDTAGNARMERINGKDRTYQPSSMIFLFPMSAGVSWNGTITESGENYAGIQEVRIRVM